MSIGKVFKSFLVLFVLGSGGCSGHANAKAEALILQGQEKSRQLLEYQKPFLESVVDYLERNKRDTLMLEGFELIKDRLKAEFPARYEVTQQMVDLKIISAANRGLKGERGIGLLLIDEVVDGGHFSFYMTTNYQFEKSFFDAGCNLSKPPAICKLEVSGDWLTYYVFYKR